MSNGGMEMWCPACKGITTCKGVNPSAVTWDKNDHEQRISIAGHYDLQFFRRGRACLSCGHEFLTGEIEIDLINELAELRDALFELKKQSKQYIEESKQVSKTIRKISKLADTIIQH